MPNAGQNYLFVDEHPTPAGHRMMATLLTNALLRSGTLPPPVDRLTFTFPLINAARQATFLVSGAAKADIVREVLSGGGSREAHPSKGVQPVDGTLTWLLDEAASGKLNRRA